MNDLNPVPEDAPVLPTNTSDPISHSVFTLFPKLPLELRLEIWNRALPGPRKIRFTSIAYPQPYGKLKQSPTLDLMKQTYKMMQTNGFLLLPFNERSELRRVQTCGFYFKANAGYLPVPSLLHVNPESRQVALEYYKLYFKENMNGRQLYMNVEIDMLVFADTIAFSAFHDISNIFSRGVPYRLKLPEGLEMPFRYLGIGETHFAYAYPDTIFKLLDQYTALERLSIARVSQFVLTATKFEEGVYRRWNNSRRFAAARGETRPNISQKLPKIDLISLADFHPDQEDAWFSSVVFRMEKEIF